MQDDRLTIAGQDRSRTLCGEQPLVLGQQSSVRRVDGHHVGLAEVAGHLGLVELGQQGIPQPKRPRRVRRAPGRAVEGRSDERTPAGTRAPAAAERGGGEHPVDVLRQAGEADIGETGGEQSAPQGGTG